MSEPCLYPCPDCPFGGPRVGGKGDPNSPLIIIGESPGMQELKAKKPFVGPSGKVLDTALAQVKDLGEPYVINAMQCFPGYASDKNEETLKRGVSACRQHVLAEIARAPRRVILALGTPALWSVTNNYDLKITQERGKLLPVDTSEIGAIASVHPAFLMRGGAGATYQQFMRDVKYAGSLTNGEEPKKPPNVQYEFARDERDIRDLAVYFRSLGPQHVIAGDVETTGLSYLSHKIICMGFAPTAEEVYGIPEHLVEEAGELFENDAYFMWHNGKFDVKFCWQAGHKRARVDEDSMLMSYCLVPETRVLTSDLRWIEIGEIKDGDELVGFDEYDPGRSGPTSIMSPTKVLATKRQVAKCYRITTSRGTVTCSENHMWAVKRYGQAYRRWVKTKDLAESNGKASLSLFVDPWDSQDDYDAGYISGILDGEGCISSTYQGNSQSNWTLGFAQKPGLVLNRCKNILTQKGFEFKEYAYDSHAGANQIKFLGSNAAMRVLGSFRPSRLLAKAGKKVWVGNRKCTQVEIESIEYVGELEVVGVETESKTFVAEGFLSHNCLDENGGIHDLETVASDWLGSPNWKGVLHQYLPKKAKKGDKNSYYELIPRDTLHHYMCLDIGNTRGLYDVLRPKINADAKLKLAYEQTLIPAANFLAKVESRGIYADLERIQENRDWYGERIDGYRREFFAIGQQFPDSGYTDKMMNSWKQIQKLLYDDLKLRPHKGSRSTDADHLEKLPQVPAITLLMKSRKDNKEYGTYVKNVAANIDIDGCVHTTYMLHGTKTGRLASKDPNLQNVPRNPRIRGQYVAKPGRRFLEPDLNQAELRALACFSGDPTLCHIYETAGMSLHDELRADIWGHAKDWNDEAVDKYLRKFGLTHENRFGEKGEDRIIEEQKMRAKAVNFGIVYGRTAPSIAEEFSIPPNEAQIWINAWFRKFPKAKNFLDSCRDAPVKSQVLVNAFGFKRRFGVVGAERLQGMQNEASNFPPQSSASHITLHSGMEVEPRLYNEYDSYICNLVHDSLLIDCPDDDDIVAAVAKVTIAKMEEVPTKWGFTRIPFVSEAKMGYRWGSLSKYKPPTIQDPTRLAV